MFGWKRRKPFRLVPFAEASPRTFSQLLCDGVTAHNLPSFTELLALHARLQEEHPDRRVLASLDNLIQACYTSGHAAFTHELDGMEGHDLSGLDEDLVEEGEYVGDFDSPAEFPFRLANLLKLARSVQLEQAAGVLDWETPGDSNDLITVNGDPERALQISKEKEVIFQFVPVDSAADAIAAFPNGYFNSDLDPMQNHALARHLEARYRLALFGIGSSFLGFRRGEALQEEEARALAAELAAFYRGTPPGAADQLAQLITGRDWLLVRYSES